MSTTKTAVDAATKKYWEELLGDYGALLVRDIPRKLKAALSAAHPTPKTAASGAPEAEPKILVLGAAKVGARISVEGVSRLGTSVIPFVAQFDEDGRMASWKV